MISAKDNTSRLYFSRVPSIVSIITSIAPVIVVILGLNVNPWIILSYSIIAIPIGIISIIAGLIGLKTKLWKLAIVSLIMNLIIVIFMVTR